MQPVKMGCNRFELQPMIEMANKNADLQVFPAMTIAAIMVYVDVAQQAEEQVRVARSLAARFDAALIGVSALAVKPSFVAEGVIIEETTAHDRGKMKADLTEKERWFRNVVGFPKERVEWRWALQYPLDFLANEARSADLVVVKNIRRWSDDPYRLVDAR